MFPLPAYSIADQILPRMIWIVKRLLHVTSCTGLMWSKKEIDVNEDNEITDEDKLPWLEAVQYAQDITFAGYNDWRIPNAQELMSIINLSLSQSRITFEPFDFKSIGIWSESWSSTSSRLNAATQAYAWTFPAGDLLKSKFKNEQTLIVMVRGPILSK